MKLTFLGAGAFGQALSKVAEYNGHEVHFYDPYKFPDLSLETQIKGADVVIFTAPSSTAAEILPKLDEDTPLICASKGFLSPKPFEKFKDFSVLSGAAFATDFEAGKAIRETATSPLSEQLFSTENITIEYTPDTIGVLLCGTLKNIYAIGAGMYGETREETEQAENTAETTRKTEQTGATTEQAPLAYLEAVIPEMVEILTQNGGKKDTLKLSCGVPDLLLSCTNGSRNFNFGKELKLAKETGKPLNLVKNLTLEGVSAIRSLKNPQDAENTTDFLIPSSATILKDIITEVENALK